jgi:putative membrane protein
MRGTQVCFSRKGSRYDGSAFLSRHGQVRSQSNRRYSFRLAAYPLSVERTMMSWIRTAVSLIGFGFAIVQFFERLQQMPGLAPASFPRAPQYLGLALISCGVLALLVSIWEYRWTIRYMWTEPFEQVAGMRSGVSREQMHSPVMAIAALLVFIGLFAFFAVLLRQV